MDFVSQGMNQNTENKLVISPRCPVYLLGKNGMAGASWNAGRQNISEWEGHGQDGFFTHRSNSLTGIETTHGYSSMGHQTFYLVTLSQSSHKSIQVHRGGGKDKDLTSKWKECHGIYYFFVLELSLNVMREKTREEGRGHFIEAVNSLSKSWDLFPECKEQLLWEYFVRGKTRLFIA